MFERIYKRASDKITTDDSLSFIKHHFIALDSTLANLNAITPVTTSDYPSAPTQSDRSKANHKIINPNLQSLNLFIPKFTNSILFNIEGLLFSALKNILV